MTKTELQDELEKTKAAIYALTHEKNDAEARATQAEQKANALELQITELQTQLSAAKNDAIHRASLHKCLLRLRELNFQLPAIAKGYRALDAVEQHAGTDGEVTFAEAYRWVCYVDKNGPPSNPEAAAKKLYGAPK